MIIDVTGTELIPGNGGRDCPGNGNHFDKNGEPLPICCDECDYLKCCLDLFDNRLCRVCKDKDCPRQKKGL